MRETIWTDQQPPPAAQPIPDAINRCRKAGHCQPCASQATLRKQQNQLIDAVDPLYRIDDLLKNSFRMIQTVRALELDRSQLEHNRGLLDPAGLRGQGVDSCLNSVIP